ncbi:MAG: tetratricopeptide repeat protein, partial [Burkholderiaceae bacterium]
ALDHPALVAQLLARLVGLGSLVGGQDGPAMTLPPGQQRSAAEFARQAISLGDFRLAAALYWRAFDQADTHETQLDLLMQVARAEQAGNRLPEFFIALESRLDGLTLDTERYRILARLALAANRLDLAERFAKRMLRFSGWWEGLNLAEVGKIFKTGLHWLFSAASYLSPISTAHAQEVEPDDELRQNSRSLAKRPVLRLVQLDLESPAADPLDHAGLEALISRVIAEPELVASVPERPQPAPAGSVVSPVSADHREEQAFEGEWGDSFVPHAASPEQTAIDELTASESSSASVSAAEQQASGAQVLQTSDPTSPSFDPAANTGVTGSIEEPGLPAIPHVADPAEVAEIGTVPDLSQRAKAQPAATPITLPAQPETSEEVALEQIIREADARYAIRQSPEPARQQAAAEFTLRFKNRPTGRDLSLPVASRFPATPSLGANQRWLTDLQRETDARLIDETEVGSRQGADQAEVGAAGTDDALAALDMNAGILIERAPPASEYRTNAVRSNREPGERPHLAFSQELYLLAYQVFLARGSIDNAYAVALAAVDQRPELTEWRIRLAETAQWSQRPLMALKQWQFLANRFNTPEYWNKAAGLAEGVRDKDAVLKYLHWHLSRHPQDTASILKVARTYENKGEPRRAMRWLAKRIGLAQPDRRKDLYQELGDVAERAGDQELMISTLSTMNELYGPDIRRAMRLASAYYIKADPAAAFAALKEAADLAGDPARHDSAAEKELRFWANYAEMARVLQRTDDALRGYRHMLALNQFTADNLTVMASVLEGRSLSAAAEVMSMGYFRYLDAQFAQSAINLWFRDGRLDLVEAFLSELAPQVKQSLTGRVDYLQQRAAYYQASGDMKKSIVDLSEIFRIAPGDMDNRAALIWALLATNDADRLTRVLRSWDRVARNEPGLWGPFGAALLSLGEADKALKFFVWQARDRDDYLWWLAYADALDATGRQDAAWTLRRRAWTELRKDARGELAESAEKRNRIVGLAMRFAPADQARALIAQLIKDRRDLATPQWVQKEGYRPGSLAITAEIAGSASAGTVLASVLRDATEQSPASAPATIDAKAVLSPAESIAMRSAASELAVSYMLGHNNVDEARAWLLSRYAKDLTKPAWAQLSIALANHDNTELDRLLTTMPDWLPRLDRIEALQRVGRVAQAQTESFELLSAQPNNDTSHQRVVDTLMAENQPSVGLTTISAQQGVLDYRRHRLDGSLLIDQHATAYAFAETGSTNSTDPAILRNADTATRHIGVGLNWTRPEGNWMAEVATRQGLESNPALRAKWQRAVSPMLDVSLSGGMNQPTTELPALIVGGQKDYVEAQTTLNLTGRDYLTGTLGLGRLETQLGTRVGRVNRISLEYGHRWRIDYPDITLRTQLTASNYTKTNVLDPIMTRLAPLGALNPVDSFVPASSKQLDVFLNVGESISNRYTRALRLFGEAGLSWSTVGGTGFSLRGGLSTSVFGTDRLTLYGSLSSKSPGNTRGSQEFGLTYRLHY